MYNCLEEKAVTRFVGHNADEQVSMTLSETDFIQNSCFLYR